jgi:hypothetical protein
MLALLKDANATAMPARASPGFNGVAITVNSFSELGWP